MHAQHHRTDPDPNRGPDRPLWDATIAALTAAGIDVVQAGDGRPGAVLQPGPRDLAVAVDWQPTDQHPRNPRTTEVRHPRSPARGQPDDPSHESVSTSVIALITCWNSARWELDGRSTTAATPSSAFTASS
ncbi:hypothetical protein ABT263_34860 [Kitasatospora sp. NPDC001603]|uniref:hypothetical protein n=1 Tax=Kitasatospora sp. NPDC001603 TaxID=3154388 RepID=UPI00331BDE47